MKNAELKKEFVCNLDKPHLSFDDMKTTSKDSCLWRCSLCRHEWVTQFKSRAGQVRKCPNCNNKKQGKKVTDRAVNNNGTLAKMYPELLDEWDYSKNEISPFEIPCTSDRKAIWTCRKCGYSYQQRISNKTKRHQGCPKCAGRVVDYDNSMAILVPEILEYIDEDYNGISPNQFRPNSHIEIHLKCPKCNFKWISKPYVFTAGHRCPACEHKVASPQYNLKVCYPLVAELFLENRNNIIVTEILPHSNKQYWFKCGVCGKHTKRTVDKAVTRGVMCNECSHRYQTSFPEQAVFFYAKKYFGNHTLNRYLVNGCKNNEIDVFIPDKKVGIEFNSYYRHKDKIKADEDKVARAKKLGIRVFRIVETNNLIYKKSADFAILPINFNYTHLSEAIANIFHQIEPSFNYSINVNADCISITEQLYQQVIRNNIKELYPKISNYWDYEKNGNLKPEYFSKGSNKYVYFINDEGLSSLSRISSKVKSLHSKNKI